MNEPIPVPQIEQAMAIDRTLLVPSSFQKDRVSRRGNLDELAASMREVGVLEPLLVRPLSKPLKDRKVELVWRPLSKPLKDCKFELVCGHRRWLAAELAGLADVPCLVREYSDGQVLEERVAQTQTDYRRYRDWAADNAQPLRRAVDEAIAKLGREVVSARPKAAAMRRPPADT